MSAPKITGPEFAEAVENAWRTVGMVEHEEGHPIFETETPEHDFFAAGVYAGIGGALLALHRTGRLAPTEGQEGIG